MNTMMQPNQQTQTQTEAKNPMVPAGYKQTEVGVIPEDWEAITVQDVCGYIVPGRNKPTKFDGDIPWITTPDLIDGRVVHFSRSELMVTKKEAELVGSKIVPAGSVVMSCVGELGLVAIAGCKIVINQQLHAFLPKNKVNNKYLVYALKTQEDYFYSAATKTALPYLNKDNCNATPIALPSLKEQTAIANALSDVDALIGSLEALIAKKQAIKTATMQQLLTGRIRLPQFATHPYGSPKGYKTSELGEIPEDWEIKNVRGVISNNFCGPSPSCEERNIIEGEEWGVLKTTASTVERGWDWKCHKVLPKAFWNNEYIELRPDDVIVTKAGPRHRVGIAVTIDYIPKGIVPSGKMIALRPIASLIHPYMLSLSIMGRTSQDFLNQRTTGMAEAQLNYENEDLLNTPIIVQSIEEQTAIATILSDMDEEIQALETRLAKTRDLKQGMMQQLLTGKIRLVKPLVGDGHHAG